MSVDNRPRHAAITPASKANEGMWVAGLSPDPDPLLSIRKSRLEALLREAWQDGWLCCHGEHDPASERAAYVARALTELEQA